MGDRSSLDDARRFLALLARPGDVFELRGLVKVNGQQHVTSGFFDDLDALAKEAVRRSGQDTGVYLTLNPCLPALLARAPKNKTRRAGSGDTTSDKDVLARRALLVDVDPVRPAGISSTDQEHQAALELVRQIRDDLVEAGWPEPIYADSGNGGHLVFGLDLPVDDGGLVERVLGKLAERYHVAAPVELKVDRKVANPARISKIYGTLTKKGEDTADRPHRVARILDAPAELVPVPRALLDAMAPAPAPANGNAHRDFKPDNGREPFDLAVWLSRHLPDATERSWTSGRKWILPVCPFNAEHDRGEAYVTQQDSGVIAAGCLHESCFKSWAQLVARLDPERAERKERFASGSMSGGRRMTDREPPPEVVYEDASYAAELDAFAARDRERPTDRPSTNGSSALSSETAVPPIAPPPPWRFAPELVDAIMERAADPWVDLTLGGESLVRIRAGGTAVLIGGSGSGKSSLTACMLIEHAVNIGPAIALSIELPGEEFGARIVGIKCDASWEEALTGRVERRFMEQALALPRLYVIDRRRATLANLEKAVEDARKRFAGEPILVAIDYAQLLDSKEREARMKVADAFAQIDDCAREKRFVCVALSQMSRASAVKARRGEALGAESADLGAETAAIERFATVTLSIGLAAERENGSSAVELSIGKWRMGKGDRVFPMDYEGRTGRWRIAGEAQKADEVRDKREVEKESKADKTTEAAMIGIASRSAEPLTKGDLKKQVSGNAGRKSSAIARLIKNGDLVEVAQRANGAKKNDWKVWTPDRARDAGTPLVYVDHRELPLGGQK